mmetsp:Transcript_7458/g.18843  ORF Transcript_7458/g.18843 Transcript_7458/m.18843 type:complete len:641 (-) Transcript_7458:141-2063(-)
MNAPSFDSVTTATGTATETAATTTRQTILSERPFSSAIHLPEGYAFQHYQSSSTTTTLTTMMSNFCLPLLLLLLIWSSNGFRAFLRRIRSRRPFRGRRKVGDMHGGDDDSLLYEPSLPAQDDHGAMKDFADNDDEQDDMDRSSSSLRETSRILLQVVTEKGFDLLPFNFSADDIDMQQPVVEDLEYEPDYDADVVHICFLVHGLNGMSKDLSYLKRAMTETALDRREQARNANNKTHDVVLYAPFCNELRTNDGLVAGGERLVDELRDMIHQEMEERLTKGNRTKAPTITLSFVGNSLGGLYSRYAIAKLVDRFCQEEGGALILDGKYRMFLNIFCTTATPHLGVASHTFIRLPRTAEVGVAHAMGQTGRDIFRVNDLLRQMATKSHYLVPLKKFQQRIAYANAYGTDFPVPVHTAAFLNHESDYPHHFAEEGDDLQKQLVEEHSDLHIATMHTPAQHHDHLDDDVYERASSETGDNELVHMSRSLDALGWKKVFVDPRKIVPKLSNPIRKSAVVSAALARLSYLSNSSSGSDGESFLDSDNEDSEHQEEDGPVMEAADISRLKARGVAHSKEIFQALTAPPEANEQPFHWPFGHNMIVAMSRNSVYTYLNKGGRPIVDGIAAQLVDDIVAFDEPQPDKQ